MTPEELDAIEARANGPIGPLLLTAREDIRELVAEVRRLQVLNLSEAQSLDALEARVSEMEKQVEPVCVWVINGGDGSGHDYVTECGRAYYFPDLLEQREVYYCPGCGGFILDGDEAKDPEAIK